MSIKHLILFITTILSAEIASAQLQFKSERFDFGRIAEEGGKRSCTFQASNVGDKPLLLVDIVTTCGCTVPTFSRKPILPGKSTEIVVTFDPYGRPGTFDRKLHIYGAGNERLGVISIVGEVTPRPKSIEELYPIEAGGGIRLSGTRCTFPYIYIGRSIASAISIINTSDQPRRIDFPAKHTSHLLQIDAPTLLQPGERSAINFRYEIPTEDPRYGSIRDVRAIHINGKASEKVLLIHGIAVDAATKTEKEAPPKAEISENILKFGAIKHDAKPHSLPLTLRNTGSSELILRAVECAAPCQASFPIGQRLAPGEQLEGQITLHPRAEDYGFVTGELLVVTNDPERPLRRIRIHAVVEE